MVATTSWDIAFQQSKQNFAKSLLPGGALTGDAFLDRQSRSMATAVGALGSYGTFGGKFIIGALVAGSFDALGQYSYRGYIRPEQTMFAALTGGSLVRFGNGNLIREGVIGGVQGGLNAQFQNIYYEDNNRLDYAVGLGVFAGGVGSRFYSPSVQLKSNQVSPFSYYDHLPRKALGVKIVNFPSLMPSVEDKK